MATSGALAVASTLGAEYGFAKFMHADPKNTIVSMLLGTVMGMMGSMALNGTGVWSKVKVAAFFPVAVGGGLVVGALVGGNTDLMLVVFVAVMFVAVAIRRFGIPYFFYGFMGWIGYFFASFMKATLVEIPALMIAILIATVWITLLSITVMRTNPERTLQRTVIAFRARARAVAHVCADLLRATDDRQRVKLKRKLHSRQVQLAEAALMVEGWSAEPGAVAPDRSAPVLRRRLLDAQHVLDRLAGSSEALTEGSTKLALAAAEVVEHLAQREDAVAQQEARNLVESAASIRKHTGQFGGEASPPSALSVHWQLLHVEQFANAVIELAELAIATILEGSVRSGEDDPLDEFEPVVGLFMGNLPGSPAIAGDVPARGTRWNPLARFDLPTRQAIQVAVAGGLAILAGRELSPLRYYWAVIAAFVMFTGTATRTETYLKGVSRVVGTLLGLVASIWLVELTGGRATGVVVIVVLCIFFGFYLFRVNYAYMIFFITIMLGQLYSVLHMFSPGLLLLRLEETVIGATIGFLVAIAVVPLSTRDTVASVRKNLFLDLASLLNVAAEKMEGDDACGVDLDAHSRALDMRVHQLALVAKPLSRPLIWGRSARARHRVALHAALTTAARGLAVGLRKGNPENAAELAGVCRDLARAAEHQAQASPKSPTPDAVLQIHIPAQLDDPVANPITRRLMHLQSLLYDIAIDPADPL